MPRPTPTEDRTDPIAPAAGDNLSASGSSRPGRSARDAGCALAPARVFVNSQSAGRGDARRLTDLFGLR